MRVLEDVIDSGCFDGGMWSLVLPLPSCVGRMSVGGYHSFDALCGVDVQHHTQYSCSVTPFMPEIFRDIRARRALGSAVTAGAFVRIRQGFDAPPQLSCCCTMLTMRYGIRNMKPAALLLWVVSLAHLSRMHVEAFQSPLIVMPAKTTFGEISVLLVRKRETASALFSQKSWQRKVPNGACRTTRLSATQDDDYVEMMIYLLHCKVGFETHKLQRELDEVKNATTSPTSDETLEPLEPRELKVIVACRQKRKIEQELDKEMCDLNNTKEPRKWERDQLEKMKEDWKEKKDMEKVKGFLRSGNWDLLPTEFFDDFQICSSMFRHMDYMSLSHVMKCDVRIIRAAFRYYGDQQYLHANIPWYSIPIEAQNDPEVVVAALRESHCFGLGDRWEQIPTAMQNNIDVGWEAVRRGIRTIEELPFLLATRESALTGVNRGSIKWKQLPDLYRSDLELASSVDIKEADSHRWSPSLVSVELLEHFPVLRSDRSFWLRVARGGGVDSEFFDTYATPDIRSDADVVFQLAESRPSLFLVKAQYSSSLWDDAAFVTRLSSSCAWWLQEDFLLALPHEKQRGYLDLVLANIDELKFRMRKKKFSETEKLAAGISKELWSDRRVVETWFKSSHPFIDQYHHELQNDKEVFLWIAENCKWTESFNKIGPLLLEDKAYLAQVLQQSPRRYIELPQHIQKDCSLAILFYGGANTRYQNIKRFLDDTNGDDTTTKLVEELQTKWKIQLDDKDMDDAEKAQLVKALANIEKYKEEEEKNGSSAA